LTANTRKQLRNVFQRELTDHFNGALPLAPDDKEDIHAQIAKPSPDSDID
jgi:hypothetical protein